MMASSAFRPYFVVQAPCYADTPDACSPDSTVNMTIRDSWIDTGDDAVCPKGAAGYGQGLQNLLVENVVARSRSSAFKIGSTTATNMTDILVTNFWVRDSNRGLAIQHRDNGTINNIVFQNVYIDSTSRQPTTWWGAGEAIWVTSVARDNATMLGPVSNVHFRNITVFRAEQSALVSARGSPMPMTNVTFTGVHYVVRNSPVWRPNKLNLKFTPPEHDYRPSPPPQDQQTCGSGPSDAECDGFYFENCVGCSIDATSSMTVDGPQQPWMGKKCVGHDPQSKVTVEQGFSCVLPPTTHR